MRKLIYTILLLLAVFLVACGNQGSPEASATDLPAPVATDTAAVVSEAEPVEVLSTSEEPVEVQPTPEATVDQSTSTDAETGSAVKVYKIVPGESAVTYEVGETFINQNNRFNLAIGSTAEINGEISGDPTNPQSAKIGVITIDISQFASDSGRRDNFIRNNFLESAKFPQATFTPTSIEGLPDTYTEGQEISFTVNGDLTVKETTLPVTFDVTASFSGDTLKGVATTTILLSDFKVGPISLAGILNTEDEAKLTLTFVARP